jgi:dolichol-phosphate mannosyltransferase
MIATLNHMDAKPGVLQILQSYKIAVVIPSYKVTAHILSVIDAIGPEVWRIYVVDDMCPEESGKFVNSRTTDSRVVVLTHEINYGVGGAVMTGYKRAIQDGADVIVKVDGDGQMDPTLIAHFVLPIINGQADYTKGNRFFNLEKIREMPAIRLFGNTVLSFMTKLSSGYWDLFDPTNGYTAIHAEVARRLPFHKISKRYFFETDILFRLNTIRAVVADVPMDAKYADEISNLKISKIAGEFFLKHLRNFGKRIFYSYYLRDMSIASLELPLGLLLIIFGVFFGGWHWFLSLSENIPASAGTVMLSALPSLMGLQLVLAFLNYDILSVPKKSIHQSMSQ